LKIEDVAPEDFESPGSAGGLVSGVTAGTPPLAGEPWESAGELPGCGGPLMKSSAFFMPRRTES
jgi:hypothetical protein